MDLVNLNFMTIITFIIVLILVIFIFYRTYLSQLLINESFRLLSTSKYFYIKYILLIISFTLILLSIFWLKFWDKITWNTDLWIDMMFVLDVSKSMNVADMQDGRYLYTRLDIMKKSISKYVVDNPENRYWLVIFAWDAVSTIPLTIDKNIFLTFLQNVDYRNLTVQGSDFEKALSLWVERFSSSDWRSKALVFISDWWDQDDIINSSNLKKISNIDKWINFYVVWVWTKSWWKIITWKDVFWRLDYQTYKWEYVISTLNKNNLDQISNSMDADLFYVYDIDDLADLNKSIKKLEKSAIETDINWIKADWWRILSIIWFFFFILFIFLYLYEFNFYKLRIKQWRN